MFLHYFIADTSFLNAVQVVVTWLERGDCNKRNVNVFYSIIQSTNSHVRRLLSEKNQFEEELQNVKDLTKRRMQAILLQCKYNPNYLEIIRPFQLTFKLVQNGSKF